MTSETKAATETKGYAVRFHLQNGEKVSLRCKPSMTFGEIKETVWKKKNFVMVTMNDYIFQSRNAELTFTDDQSFQEFLKFKEVFRDVEFKGHNELIEVLIIKKDKAGERLLRDAKMPGDNLPFVHKGLVSIRTQSLGFKSKKQRYLVIQSYTAFYYENEDQHKEKKQALGWFPLGAAVATETENPDGSGYCLSVSQLGSPEPVILICDTKEDSDTWLNAINTVYMRRTKTICVHSGEELRRRGLDLEGIFRVSGSKESVDQLRADYEAGDVPDLTKIQDSHALAGLMKLVIRELPIPLLTFQLYDPLVKLGDLDSAEERIVILKTILAALPVAHAGLLQYLMLFLGEVAQHCEKNKMETKNLAIVFAPNILRPVKETAQTVMMHSRNVLLVIEMMISGFQQIWPEGTIPGQRGEDDPYLDESASFSSQFPNSVSTNLSSKSELSEKSSGGILASIGRTLRGSVSSPPPHLGRMTASTPRGGPPPVPISFTPRPGHSHSPSFSSSRNSISLPVAKPPQPSSPSTNFKRTGEVEKKMKTLRNRYQEKGTLWHAALQTHHSKAQLAWRALLDVSDTKISALKDNDYSSLEESFEDLEKQWNCWERSMEVFMNKLKKLSDPSAPSEESSSSPSKSSSTTPSLPSTVPKNRTQTDPGHSADVAAAVMRTLLDESNTTTSTSTSTSDRPPPPPPSSSSSSSSDSSSPTTEGSQFPVPPPPASSPTNSSHPLPTPKSTNGLNKTDPLKSDTKVGKFMASKSVVETNKSQSLSNIKPGFRSPKNNKAAEKTNSSSPDLLRKESTSLEQRKAALGLTSEEAKKNLYKMNSGTNLVPSHNPYKSRPSEATAPAPPPPATSATAPSALHIVEALYDHIADTTDGELSLVGGARYVVTDSQDSEGWWEAYKEDDPSQKGLVPSNFLKRVS